MLPEVEPKSAFEAVLNALPALAQSFTAEISVALRVPPLARVAKAARALEGIVIVLWDVIVASRPDMEAGPARARWGIGTAWMAREERRSETSESSSIIKGA